MAVTGTKAIRWIDWRMEMTQIVYVSDTMKQAISFINDLIPDLEKLGIENIKHDWEHNFITVGDIEVRGISIYENCLCLKINHAEYFIDGIDMENYKNASGDRLKLLTQHVKEIMSHFAINAKQLSGKDELIKILVEG